jgi:hypothetical protein
VLDPPGPMPQGLFITGLIIASVVSAVAGAKAQRGVTGSAKLTGSLLGGTWIIGFAALFVLITAVSGVVGDPHLPMLMWPSGSALVIGLIYLAGGAVHRDVLQYALGIYVALVGTAAVFLDAPGLQFVMAIAGAGGYFVATALESRRLVVARVPLTEASRALGLAESGTVVGTVVLVPEQTPDGDPRQSRHHTTDSH